MVNLELWDEDYMKPDEFIGSASLPLLSLMDHEVGVVHLEYPCKVYVQLVPLPPKVKNIYFIRHSSEPYHWN